LPPLQRDACLLHVSEHVLRLRGAPTLNALITIGSPKDVAKGSWMQQAFHARDLAGTVVLVGVPTPR
jgi:hypothetical protein